jgi:hypothetical protein
MMAWEVQHHTLCQGWINTWSEEVDGVSRPLTYPSEAAAQDALEEFLREIAEEIAYGERDPDHGYDAEEFRVVEVDASVQT